MKNRIRGKGNRGGERGGKGEIGRGKQGEKDGEK